jgi:hypothetical protein
VDITNQDEKVLFETLETELEAYWFISTRVLNLAMANQNQNAFELSISQEKDATASIDDLLNQIKLININY